MRKFILIIVLISSVLTLIVGILNINLYLILTSVVAIAVVLTLFDLDAKINHLNRELYRVRTKLRKRGENLPVNDKYRGYEDK